MLLSVFPIFSPIAIVYTSFYPYKLSYYHYPLVLFLLLYFSSVLCSLASSFLGLPHTEVAQPHSSASNNLFASSFVFSSRGLFLTCQNGIWSLFTYLVNCSWKEEVLLVDGSLEEEIISSLLLLHISCLKWGAFVMSSTEVFFIHGVWECVNVLFPSSRRKRRTKTERWGEGNYMLIFHKCRLSWQLVPTLWFPPRNDELSIIIVENLPQLSPSSQQQIRRWEEFFFSSPLNTIDCLPASRLQKDT